MKYNQYYIQALLTALTEKQPEVRQAAAYGIGVMAMYGQNAFSDTLKRKYRQNAFSDTLKLK